MPIDYDRLRLDGVYKQNNQGQLMLRVKAPAGVLSSEQVEKVAAISEKYSNGMLHLTTRCSVEFHWLEADSLPHIWRELAAVGLTSRGACGGAVRGISCSTTFSAGFSAVQTLAARIQRHFAGNPRFEGLPKKFKISVEAEGDNGRHLIQDAGIVLRDPSGPRPTFDVWVAGGLGREPQEAFLYEEMVPEDQILPLLEALVDVHREKTPKGRRLKHVVGELGSEAVRSLVEEKRQLRPAYALIEEFERTFIPATPSAGLEIVVYAGELPASSLKRLGELAADHCGGYLALTADQNVALLPRETDAAERLKSVLDSEGFFDEAPEKAFSALRICPGNHQCRMGLSATRDLGRKVIQMAGDREEIPSIAISGCPNSCAQPQLAKIGILARRLEKGENGMRSPRYDFTLRRSAGFGELVAENLDEDALLDVLAKHL